MPLPPNGVRLARFKSSEDDDSIVSHVTGMHGKHVSLAEVQETVLDWRYPVRVLSTEKVSKAAGHAFMRIRNELKQFKPDNTRVFSLSLNHKEDVLQFIKAWAEKRAVSDYEFREIVSPYAELLSYLGDEVFQIDGRVYYVDGLVQAVTMWEMPSSPQHTSNIWMNICNTERRGLSEFVVKDTARILVNYGIQYANYGGSETEGLDNYKKKFDPAHSIYLTSYEVEIDGVDVVWQSLLQIQGRKLAV
jgi:hypothetical protein